MWRGIACTYAFGRTKFGEEAVKQFDAGEALLWRLVFYINIFLNLQSELPSNGNNKNASKASGKACTSVTTNHIPDTITPLLWHCAFP